MSMPEAKPSAMRFVISPILSGPIIVSTAPKAASTSAVIISARSLRIYADIFLSDAPRSTFSVTAILPCGPIIPASFYASSAALSCERAIS